MQRAAGCYGGNCLAARQAHSTMRVAAPRFIQSPRSINQYAVPVDRRAGRLRGLGHSSASAFTIQRSSRAYRRRTRSGPLSAREQSLPFITLSASALIPATTSFGVLPGANMPYHAYESSGDRTALPDPFETIPPCGSTAGNALVSRHRRPTSGRLYPATNRQSRVAATRSSWSDRLRQRGVPRSKRRRAALIRA